MTNTPRGILAFAALILASLVLLVGMAVAQAGPLDETRCCITPRLNADGTNHRRADVLRAFQKFHPCPSTGLQSGACPGWAKDHVLPLENGGRDEVSNLQWLPVGLKTCKAVCKDRWERKINANPVEIVR